MSNYCFNFVRTPGGTSVPTPTDISARTPGGMNVLDIIITRALYVLNLYLLLHKRNNRGVFEELAIARKFRHGEFEKKAVAAM